MSGEPPALPARLHPLVRAFLDDRAAVAAVADSGTPAHVVFPQVLAENVGALAAVLDRSPMRSRMCYAHKVNRSPALARAAERCGIGIDVASPGELANARAAGFAPARIEVTGPKGARFLATAVASGATINVDNLWELAALDDLARGTDPIPTLLRVGDLPGTPRSRFGVPLPRVDDALRLLAASASRIRFLGFAFHLDSGAVTDRVRAVQTCLALIERAHAHGLAPHVLDIGGGLRQVFTADADRFDGYVRALRAGLAGRGPAMSWPGQTFGYHVAGGAAHGTPVFHKYGNTVGASDMLAELLAAPLAEHEGRPLGTVLADNLLELWLEPGKALVDHAGLTLASVEFVKELGDGTMLVTLDLSRDTVTPADQEVMVDPLVLPGARRDDGPAVGVYFAGRLCLERDLITTRQVFLPGLPAPGDVVVFPNTAAYHMDLSASTAARWAPPRRWVVESTEAGFAARPDTEAAA
ncbi:Y4yA family PLP-dependent enzyme [Nocardia farcinica]|uniref:Y4yA family PLP-dependent enzyme n=1 Tax=Nocardia farcinica TaxID=37329 RepID=UPI001893D9CE|nr:Y4yA family PLP-dependent enzyme [Nocardia farcinica]MBF6255895.1 Y4yA family PLP-dependent enzyme [Nocardia farcinica]